MDLASPRAFNAINRQSYPTYTVLCSRVIVLALGDCFTMHYAASYLPGTSCYTTPSYRGSINSLPEIRGNTKGVAV